MTDLPAGPQLGNGGRVTIDADENGQVHLDIAQSAPQPPEPVESA